MTQQWITKTYFILPTHKWACNNIVFESNGQPLQGHISLQVTFQYYVTRLCYAASSPRIKYVDYIFILPLSCPVPIKWTGQSDTGLLQDHQPPGSLWFQQRKTNLGLAKWYGDPYESWRFSPFRCPSPKQLRTVKVRTEPKPETSWQPVQFLHYVCSLLTLPWNELI